MPSFYIFKDTNGRKKAPGREELSGPCFISEGLRRYSGIPVCRDSGMPVFRDTVMPKYRNNVIGAYHPGFCATSALLRSSAFCGYGRRMRGLPSAPYRLLGLTSSS